MVGTTLGDIRDHIESLASETGEYYLVCARYGDRPVPAADLRFDSRQTARAAARATEKYRTALRRYDSQVPYYDVIVCQETTSTSREDATDRTDEPCRNTDEPDPASERQSLIDFCHTVAGAVFEAVAASDHDAVERAIMDTYLTQAETIESPDELCLRMLESMATELDQRLSPTAQADLLVSAANRLPEPAANGDPLDATLSHLCSVALATDYTLSPCSIDLDDDARSWDVTLSGYELDDSDERFTTLPLVIDLLRRQPDPALTITNATQCADGGAPPTWRFRLASNAETDPTGLVRVTEVSTG
jgi:hypothetical protein